MTKTATNVTQLNPRLLDKLFTDQIKERKNTNDIQNFLIQNECLVKHMDKVDFVNFILSGNVCPSSIFMMGVEVGLHYRDIENLENLHGLESK